jgi:Flp pilus assembly protein TadD
MSASYQRAWVLYFELKRYDLAERELRGALVDRPDDALAHSLLCLCLTQRQQYKEAAAEVGEAVRLAPNLAFAHYARARLLGARNQLPAARTAINEAIRLDPAQSDYYSWLAAFLYDSGHWRAALNAADQGLQLNPVHVSCANLRALALAKLGHRREATATSQAALARDPVNAISHAIQATTLMRQAEFGQARAHYMEALRLDALCEWGHRGRHYARIGCYLMFLPQTIGRGVLRVLRWRFAALGGASDKAAAWAGAIVLVALNAAATGVVSRNLELPLSTLGFGLAALLLAWLATRLHYWVAAFFGALSFFPAAMWCMGILTASDLTADSRPHDTLERPLAYALAGVAIAGVLAFFIGLIQAGYLADLSLPRRKPERPPTDKP